MATRIRLRRMGAKKAPFYRIVVADSRYPRDGRFIEEIGYYDPTKHPALIKIDGDRAKYWIGTGAQPSDTVKALMVKAGILEKQPYKGKELAPAPAAADTADEAVAVEEAVAEAVEEAVAEAVAEAVEEAVEEAVAEAVAEAVEEAVAEAVVEAVEEAVAEAVEEAVAEAVEEAVVEVAEEAAEEAVVEVAAEAAGEAAAAESEE